MTSITENLNVPSTDLLLPRRQLTRARTWTGDTEWYTPPDILVAVCEVLGAIDLDPASSDAQQTLSPVKAARYLLSRIAD